MLQHGDGKTFEETRAKEKALLYEEISAAYEAYSNNQFIIPRHLSSLFTSRSLQQRLSQDIDKMQCWIRSYKEGVAVQQENNKRYTESAKAFFLPRQPEPSIDNTTPHNIVLPSTETGSPTSTS